MFPICLLACLYNFLLLFFRYSKLLIRGTKKLEGTLTWYMCPLRSQQARDAEGLFPGSQLAKFIFDQKAVSLAFLEKLHPKSQEFLQVFFLYSKCYLKTAQRNMNDLSGSAHSGGGGGCWRTAARSLVNGWAQHKEQMLGLEQGLIDYMFPSLSIHGIFSFWKMEYVYFLGTKSLGNNYKCSNFIRIYTAILARCFSRTQMRHCSGKGKQLCWVKIKSNKVRNKEKALLLRSRVPLRVASIFFKCVYLE